TIRPRTVKVINRSPGRKERQFVWHRNSRFTASSCRTAQDKHVEPPPLRNCWPETKESWGIVNRLCSMQSRILASAKWLLAESDLELKSCRSSHWLSHGKRSLRATLRPERCTRTRQSSTRGRSHQVFSAGLRRDVDVLFHGGSGAHSCKQRTWLFLAAAWGFCSSHSWALAHGPGRRSNRRAHSAIPGSAVAR